jgi:hypothetical protein
MTDDMRQAVGAFQDHLHEIQEFINVAKTYWIAAEKIANRGNGFFIQCSDGSGGIFFWFSEDKPTSRVPPPDVPRLHIWLWSTDRGALYGVCWRFPATDTIPTP